MWLYISEAFGRLIRRGCNHKDALLALVRAIVDGMYGEGQRFATVIFSDAEPFAPLERKVSPNFTTTDGRWGELLNSLQNSVLHPELCTVSYPTQFTFGTNELFSCGRRVSELGPVTYAEGWINCRTTENEFKLFFPPEEPPEDPREAPLPDIVSLPKGEERNARILQWAKETYPPNADGRSDDLPPPADLVPMIKKIPECQGAGWNEARWLRTTYASEKAKKRGAGSVKRRTNGSN
jgi:hypothetical protein